jgi:uncharacterized membrane protein
LNWLIFALIGTIFFSVAGVLDKLILSSYAEDSRAYIVCQILAQQMFTVPLLLITGMNFVYPESILALFAGSLQILPALYYLSALQVEETSRVTALEYVYPLFVFIGSMIFLGETLTLRGYLGGFLLLTGCILVSHRQNGQTGSASLSSLSPAIKPFLSYWILTAAHYLTMKYLLISLDEWHLYTWSSLGSLVAIVPLIGIPSVRCQVKGFFGSGRLAIGALISEETFMFLGIISSIFACCFGSVTLVTSVGALQPVLTLLLVLGLGVIMPAKAKEIGENTNKEALGLKALSFMIILAGVFFIS